MSLLNGDRACLPSRLSCCSRPSTEGRAPGRLSCHLLLEAIIEERRVSESYSLSLL